VSLVFEFPVSVRSRLPFGAHPSSFFQTMQRGIEGTVLHLQKVVCSSLNMLANLMTVGSAIEEGPQYEHVQGSLENSAPLRFLFCHRRHPTLNLAMMVDKRLSIVKVQQ
jgi:hypothetical protein